MYDDSRIPWVKIHEYLLEVGAATDIDDFRHKALTLLDRLVPFDCNAIFGNFDRKGVASIKYTAEDAGNLSKLHDEYYWRLAPPVAPKPGSAIATVQWSRYRDTEYYTDFMRPQGVWQSVGIFPLIQNAENLGVISLNRSKQVSPFSVTELAILEILSRHLSNMYCLFSKAAENHKPGLEPDNSFSDNKMLTKREAEIVALLCQGKSTELIASELFISPLTVYKHIKNIFEKLQVKNRQQLLIKVM